MAHERERSGESQRANCAVQGGGVLVEAVGGVLGSRRATETQKVDRDAAVAVAQKRHHGVEGHRTRGDAMNHDDDGALADITGDVQHRWSTQQPIEDAHGASLADPREPVVTGRQT